METAKKIASNTFSQVGAKFVIAALQVIIFRLITGYLGEAGYGQYTAVYEFAGLFTIAADFGLFTLAVANMTGKTKEEGEKILGSFLALRLLLVAGVTILAFAASWLLPNYNDAMRMGVLFAALANGTYLIMLTISAALQVNLKMERNAVDQVLGRCIMLVLVYLIVRRFHGTPAQGLLALFAAGLLGNLAMTAFTAWSARSYARIRLHYDPKLWRELLKTMLPYGVSLILGVLYLRIGTPLLAHFATDADVGRYGLGLKLYDLIVVFPFAFMNSVLPSFARHIRSERIHALVQYAFEFLLVIGLGALGGMYVVAPAIVRFLGAGHDFSGAETSLRIMMVAMLLNFFTSLFSYLLLTLKKEKKLLLYNAIAVLVSIGTNLLFLRLFEAKFVATATAILIPQLLVLLLAWRSAGRELKLRIRLGNPLRILLAAACMTASLVFLDRTLFAGEGTVRLLWEIPLGGLLYGLFLLLFGAVHKDALELLLRRGGRTNGGKVIAMDIRSYHAAKTGKEWYTISLLEALMEHDRDHRFLLYTRYPVDIPNLPANFEVRVIRVPIPFWHVAVVFDLVRQGVDVWLATASYIISALLVFRSPKAVTVIHDLVAFLRSNRHQMKATWVERLTLKLALAHSPRIVAVSKNTEADLVRLFRVDPARIAVIPEAARSSFRVISDIGEIRRVQKKYRLADTYLLFVGTLEPRKNLPRLVRAYATLPAETRAAYPLVLVGKRGWYYEEIFATVKELGLEKDVVFTGYVPDEDLPALLNGATLFLLPSLYEGFGLPLLEAFACDIPVITSDTPALVEVAGEGCVTIDPRNEQHIAETIASLLGDPARREEMRAWGRKRVSQFSWTKTAEEIHELLMEVARK